MDAESAQVEELKAEIERLQALVRYHCEEQMKGWQKAREQRQLITELADALEKANPTDRYRNLLQRVRETK